MDLIYHGDQVIGSVTYIERHDNWKAESIHQQKPQTFYSEKRAVDWIRQMHAEEDQ